MAETDRYSRLVFWLKVALPIAALSILSTLFFVAETLDPEAAIPFAEVDVERILTEQRIGTPTFGGVTANGVAIALKASSVRPNGSDQELTAQALEAGLDLPNGGRIEIESPSGNVDVAAQLITLDGGARLESSTGIVVTTERIQASISDGTVIAERPVQAVGPAGTLTAGAMELTRSKTGDTHVLVFKDGVSLVYQPKQ